MKDGDDGNRAAVKVGDVGVKTGTPAGRVHGKVSRGREGRRQAELLVMAGGDTGTPEAGVGRGATRDLAREEGVDAGSDDDISGDDSAGAGGGVHRERIGVEDLTVEEGKDLVVKVTTFPGVGPVSPLWPVAPHSSRVLRVLTPLQSKSLGRQVFPL